MEITDADGVRSRRSWRILGIRAARLGGFSCGVAAVGVDVLRLGELHLCSLGESQWISDGSGVDGLRVPDVPGVLDADAFDLAWLGTGGEVRQPLLRTAETAFEDVAPVREFPSYRGQRHFPGLYWAASMNRHVGFESWLERDHAIVLDFDPQVVAFASQPFWLHWRDAGTGQARAHAPDFFARLSSGFGLVVDCRPVDRVDARSAAAFAAMGWACEAVGWDYRLVGEIDLVRVANLRWLATGTAATKAGLESRRRCVRRFGIRRRWWRRRPWSVTQSRCCRWCSTCCGRGC